MEFMKEYLETATAQDVYQKLREADALVKGVNDHVLAKQTVVLDENTVFCLYKVLDDLRYSLFHFDKLSRRQLLELAASSVKLETDLHPKGQTYFKLWLEDADFAPKARGKQDPEIAVKSGLKKLTMGMTQEQKLAFLESLLGE